MKQWTLVFFVALETQIWYLILNWTHKYFKLTSLSVTNWSKIIILADTLIIYTGIYWNISHSFLALEAAASYFFSQKLFSLNTTLAHWTLETGLPSVYTGVTAQVGQVPLATCWWPFEHWSSGDLAVTGRGAADHWQGLVAPVLWVLITRPDPGRQPRPATTDMTGGREPGEVSFKNNDALFMVQYNTKYSFGV